MPQLKELIKKIYTLEYYSTFIKKEILSSATTWMKLEGTMQSAISQTEKHGTIYMCNQKKKHSSEHDARVTQVLKLSPINSFLKNVCIHQIAL